jgi:hypothetical protein
MWSRGLVPAAIVTLVVVAVTVSAETDDRTLLWDRGAPPNVMLLVDSAATMTHQPPLPEDEQGEDYLYQPQTLPGSGDDAGSKLSQIKSVLPIFLDSFLDFNMGFSFFEKADVQVLYLNYLYEVEAVTTTSGASRSGLLDGSAVVGGVVRLGSSYNPNNTARWQIPVRFGALGNEITYVYASTGTDQPPATPGPNEIRWASCLVDPATGQCKTGTGPPYYYPAYHWGDSSEDGLSYGRWVRLGLEGSRTWQEIAIHNGIDVAVEGWEAILKAYVLADIEYRGDPWCVIDFESGCPADTPATLEEWKATASPNQIGSTSLTMLEWQEAATTAGKDLYWEADPTVDPVIARLSFRQEFVLYDRDPTEGESTQLSSSKGTLTSVTWSQVGSDCSGYLDPEVQDRPLLPIPTDDEPSNRERIRDFMGPQTNPIFFFPGNSDAYLPNSRDHYVPRTETVLAAGRRPLKASLVEAYRYFNGDVLQREDEFEACRKNFIILLTDGVETCNSDTAPCTPGVAGALADIGVPVYVIGYGLDPDANPNVIECIATATGGRYFSASTPEDLLDALIAVAKDIEERTRGFSSIVVPSVQATTDQSAYIATFLPSGGRSIWEGHLRAYPVTAGQIPTKVVDGVTVPDNDQALWDVGERLAATSAAARTMYYGTSSGAVPGDRWAFDQPGGQLAADRLRGLIRGTLTDAELSDVISFIRGDRDSVLGATVYERDKLGDSFHSTARVVGAPSCYTCYLTDQHAADGRGYRAFRDTHRRRRRVLLFGANDGAFHAVEAGLWDESEHKYDDGTGDELFAWVPSSVMPTLDNLTFAAEHRWTVDGAPTVADVFIDPSVPATGSPVLSEREWRSVVIVGQRRGGRSYLCLDVTQPDAYDSSSGLPDVVATSSNRSPSCAAGGSDCSGTWPALRWEFTDTSDQDGNGHPDLGQTWSDPLVGFVSVADDNGTPQERSVVIFGGGYDPFGRSGNALYMVDIETGEILFKETHLGMIPGQVAALDVDLDGYFERVYFGTTHGDLMRLDLTTVGVTNASTGRVTNWLSTTVFSAGPTQPFFLEPKLVPVDFSSAGEIQVAIAIGSGNRANLFERNTAPHRFYMVFDRESGTVLTEDDLQAVFRDGASTDAGTNYLVGDPNIAGWYLILGTEEKVNTSALVFNQNVIFSTFTPSSDVIVTEGGLCQLRGAARTYVVNLFTADPYHEARYVLHEGGAVYATETVLFAGDDGSIHSSQLLDNEGFREPVGATVIPLRVYSWKED